jgi:hypothetical protein
MIPVNIGKTDFLDSRKKDPPMNTKSYRNSCYFVDRLAAWFGGESEEPSN